MNRPRLATLCLFIAILVCLATPSSASAQWATSVCEQDWTLKIGERNYGVQQILQRPGDCRYTQVVVGDNAYRTSDVLSARQAPWLLIPAVVLAFAAAVFWGPFRARQPRSSDS